MTKISKLITLQEKERNRREFQRPTVEIQFTVGQNGSAHTEIP